MDNLVTKISLPKEIIAEILEYVYYTPEQIREMYKKVLCSIKKSRHASCESNYRFSIRKPIFIGFCKCGNYTFYNMDERVMCKC